jgi:hypothetical protein
MLHKDMDKNFTMKSIIIILVALHSKKNNLINFDKIMHMKDKNIKGRMSKIFAFSF